jgi:soluble lytic murein transglycosylase
MLARQAGLSATWRLFLAHLRYRLLDNPAEIALVAHLSERLGDTQSSLRTGKAALTRQYPLGYYAFPTQAFPNYQPLRPPPETAMLMAIARQESEFNTMTRSGAGATGVLQVMPVTARHVCRDYKMTCQLSRLATDPAYNATIASAYIGDRMAEFAGSYVLTLAGYNAGPGRARQWIREFGDPRDPGVDPVDWIERIPFEETRDYVKKVLANVQVYRARIGNEKEALQVIGDLYRASTGPPSLPDGTMGARAAASRR